MAIEKYLNNITSEHRDKPKFIAWLSSALTITDHAYLVIKNIDDSFDIDYAIGQQLDILGQAIGRKRLLTFQPLNGFNPKMDDETYRLVLKAKIAMNNWNGKVEAAYSIWDNIFNDIGLQLQDNQDMSLTAYVAGYVNQIRQDLIQHGYIVPKPEGVKINYIGKTPISFNLYSYAVVSGQQTCTINMSCDPTEKINMKQYARVTVQGIQTTEIKCRGGKVINGDI